MIRLKSPPTPSRIYVIDSQHIVRAALRYQLERHSRFAVVGGHSDLRQAIEEMRECRPDVLLLDLAVPGMDETEVMGLVRRAFPELPIVVLTHQSEESSIARAMKDGPRAYVSKDSDELELLVALDAARLGLRFVSPRLVRGSVHAASGQLKEPSLS